MIHHSSQTAVILREINRVLMPNGEVRPMVYLVDGMSAYTVLARDHLLGFWRNRTVDEWLRARAHGYMARHYSKDMMADILSLFFQKVELRTYGQDADAIQLPRRLRGLFIAMMSKEKLAERANHRELFLFAVARKPARAL